MRERVYEFVNRKFEMDLEKRKKLCSEREDVEHYLVLVS